MICVYVVAYEYDEALQNMSRGIKLILFLFIHIPLPFPPVWKVAENTKKTTNTMGILLLSSSNGKGPG